MKRALAKGIVRFRLAILAGMLLIAALCVPGIARTRINYDLTAYLAEDTMTRRSMRVMEEEFGASEQLRVLFWDVDEETLSARVQQLQALPEVFLASHDPETGRIARDGHEYRLVNLTLSECDGAALVETLRGLYPGECWVGGSAAEQLDVQESVGAEMPEVMVISVLVVLAVLLLTSHAWLEPAVLLIVLLSFALKAPLENLQTLPGFGWIQVLGRNLISIFIVFALLYWGGMARMVRSQILTLKESEYVTAARALGAGSGRIISKHLLTNCIGTLIVTTTLQIPSSIFTESFLSFLGLGVAVPMPSLGSLASDAINGLNTYPYLLFIPALLISLIILSFNLLGDGLRDAFDRKMKN